METYVLPILHGIGLGFMADKIAYDPDGDDSFVARRLGGQYGNCTLLMKTAGETT
jgi:hypothetical protein